MGGTEPTAATLAEAVAAGETSIDWHDLGAVLSDADYAEWQARIMAAIRIAAQEALASRGGSTDGQAL